MSIKDCAILHLMTKKTKLTIYLPVDIKDKAKVTAASLHISMSHLIEGLIAGVSILPERKEEN